jgi:RNA polymerase Rpb6
MEQNESEIELLSTVVRNSEGVIIDDLHRSIPFITKYERARVIGERTRQINSGAIPFIDVKSDYYSITQLNHQILLQTPFKTLCLVK